MRSLLSIMQRLVSLTPRGDGTPYVITLTTLVILFGGFIVGGVLPNFQAADGDARFPPEQKPLPTPTPRLCADNTAIDILVDSSESMTNSGKMQGLKDALTAFTDTFSDNYLVAMQSFGSTTVDVLPFKPYRDAKTALSEDIASLTPTGATYMRDAFVNVKGVISDAQKAHPDYKFNLVFVSDGVPEIDRCDPTHGPCGSDPKGYYDYTQDPTRTDAPDGKGNIAEQIKGMGVQIYTIALYDENDLATNQQLIDLLNSIASSQDAANPTSNPLALKEIYSDIADSICPAAPTP